MASLMEELQRDALNWKVPVTELLQRCLLVATKLNVKELAEWVRLELDGYIGDGKEVPEYRVIGGVPQVYNPYRGYQHLRCGNPKMAELLSRIPFGQPISEIEHMLTQSEIGKETSLHFTYSPELATSLRKMIRPIAMEPSFCVSTSQLRRIIEAVRRAVLEWTLRLETAGIKGTRRNRRMQSLKRA